MYLGGSEGEDADWINAKRIFTLLLSQRSDDGPARTILDFMEKHQGSEGEAPQNWAGHRCLEEK